MATVTLLDGGMGRELLRIGAPFRQPEWSALALAEGPDWVVRAHRNFIDAGAQVITTNSYAIVPFHIGSDRFRREGRDLAARAGQLAREAAAGDDITVAASLPPLFGSYRPDLFDANTAPGIIDPLVDGLRDHVDVWLGETLSSIAEVRAIRAALDRASAPQPLWISYYLHHNQLATIASGESVADAVATAIDLGATAVMFNCCQAELISAAIPAAVIAAAGGRTQVGGYANRFIASPAPASEANNGLSNFRDDLDPPTYCSFVGEWIDSGATIVGGCCGITPDHIAAIAVLTGANG